MAVDATYRPDPRILCLGSGFYDEVEAAAFPTRTLRFRNQRAAESVGLGTLNADEWQASFGGFTPLPGNLPKPLALRYHGHQFRSYNPALGDGRGFLFGQAREVGSKRLLDFGTKGSGQTPYSRGGDGRLTLKGGVREVLATEMLEALGVNTSKSLSLFETGEALYRGDEPSPTRSSVLVRLGHSHLRFGTFQRFAYHNDVLRLGALLAYAVDVYAPEAAAATDVPLAFFREVVARTASLAAQWMVAGFVHGVLNTDNMNITGESFDYGPYRFLPTYDTKFTAAYFDDTGLYSYGRQPGAALWNLTRLAESLRPLSPNAAFETALDEFEPTFRTAMAKALLARLGLRANGDDLDARLVEAVFDTLRTTQVGYARFFFDWYGGEASAVRALEGPAAAEYRGSAFGALRSLLSLFEPREPDKLALPYFAGEAPETMLIDEIEALWSAIDARNDWAPFEAKVARVRVMGEAYVATSAARGPSQTAR